ncbi:hypothetical protein Vafri_4127 [Volvox africanus]|uniref:Uncharacterized protein n=1 Tax=Volvox africanus TaxID=51714 RepID=A0A8J4ETJ7_9CHLO|nr:hypothetical protein Vafri_4127 [Volvox africanus]
MTDSKREISGFFVSVEKFASHVAALASPECATRHLRLFHNESHHTAAVVDALSRNASVTSLDIFELDPVAASSLATVLSASPRLAALAVHHPHGHEAVENLCCGIAVSRTLTSLHLSLLDARGVAALAAALLSWSPHSGAASPSSADAAVTAASDCTPRLQHLRLEKCSFTPDAAEALAEALGRQAGALSHLEVVDSDLGDAAAEALLAAPGWRKLLGASSVLGSLALPSCRIGLRGATQLGQLLDSSCNLHSLNLANNKALGCAGARALAEGLAANRGLLRLDLSSCGIGAVGVEALAAALRPGEGRHLADGSGSPPLQQLTLDFNAAGAAGLAALLGATSGPRTCMLRNLQLDQNRIRGAELAEALRGLVMAAEPPSPPPLPRVTAPLERLSLAGNALYDDGVKVLAMCLAEASCLEQLDLRENGISDSGVAALLPLISPRGVSERLGDAVQHAASGVCTNAAGSPSVRITSSPGLQGLLLDGNRLHNGGAQTLLAAVTAAPQLWRFSAEGNKLTDPALRLSLTQLSQLRAARHSQLMVMGRYYSSSSSSSSDDGTGGGRGSGGGAGGGAAAADRGSGGGAGDDGPHRSHGATSPMDVDVTAAAAAGPATGSAGGTPHHKHRLEDQDAAADGDQAGSGDDRQPLRNVAARGADGTALPTGGCGGGGGDGGDAALPVPVSPYFISQAGRQPASGAWCSLSCADGGPSVAAGRVCWSSGGSSSMESGGCGGDMMMLGTDGAASAASTARVTPLPVAGAVPLLCTSPPPAMCFITAISGVGGTASVGVSKRVSAVGESDHPAPQATCKLPQQVLPSCRRPRYKPLTPEQQRLFEDF